MPCVNCTHCDRAPTDCTKCSGDYYLIPGDLSNFGSCVVSSGCPVGQYGAYQNNTCNDCDDACTVCFGEGPKNCTACQGTNFLIQEIYSCVAECPAGYWQNDTFKECQKCSDKCLECEQTDKNKCTKCRDGTFLLNQACVLAAVCQESNYFPNQTSDECTQCDLNCTKCYGPSYANCTECEASRFLDITSSSCLISCENTFYPDDSSGKRVCKKCYSPCFNCTSGGSVCYACETGFLLDKTNPSGSICVENSSQCGS